MAFAFAFTDCIAGYNTLAGAQELYTSCAGAGSFGVGSNGIGFSVTDPLTWLKTLGLSNGWAINTHLTFSAVGGNVEFLRLIDANGLLVLAITRLNTGFLQLTGASGFTTQTASTHVVGGGVLTKIDVAFFYASSGGNGRVEVQVNGSRVNELTSSAFTGGTVAGFSIGGGVLAPTSFVIRNGGGASITLDAIGVQTSTTLWADPFPGFVGNKAKFALFANADGTYAPGSNWAAQNAPTVHEAIDETPGDQDATYIMTNTLSGGGSVLDRCSWQFGDMPSNTTNVSHVAHTMQVRSAPAATNATINGFLDNGTIGEGASVALPVSGLYSRIQDNAMNAPGSTGWTKNQVNAISGGVRVTALS